MRTVWLGRRSGRRPWSERPRLWGTADASLGYWRRALAVNPYNAVARSRIAELLASRQEWPDARDQAREWVRLEPDKAEARKLLIRCLLKTGDRTAAEAELKTLKGVQAGWERDLDHWFDLQQR